MGIIFALRRSDGDWNRGEIAQRSGKLFKKLEIDSLT
jgi:hypothetical protein